MMLVDDIADSGHGPRGVRFWSRLGTDDRTDQGLVALHAWAQRLHVRRVSFQNDATLPHYRITRTKRAIALRQGAHAVSTAEFMQRCQRALSGREEAQPQTPRYHLLHPYTTRLKLVLQRALQRYTAVPFEQEQHALVGHVSVDLLQTYPMGWQLAHRIQTSPISVLDLETTTSDLHSLGVDVVWWLGAAANTPEQRAWCSCTLGGSFSISEDVGRLRLYSWSRSRDRELSFEMNRLSQFTMLWRHYALVRFVSLWGPVRGATFVRALAGTDEPEIALQLRRSLAGMVGALHTSQLFQRDQDDAWHTDQLDALYPQVPRWPIEGIEHARACAYTRAAQRTEAAGPHHPDVQSANMPS